MNGEEDMDSGSVGGSVEGKFVGSPMVNKNKISISQKETIKKKGDEFLCF